MSDKSKIEWTDATWNPVTGCTKVSEGCRNCYALTFAERWRGIPGHYFENGFDITLRPDKLDQPMKWTKPRKIFVNSMSDLFHKDIHDDYITKVFDIMAQTPHHTYQVLTKRPERMKEFVNNYDPENLAPYPLPNVWLGTSVEDSRVKHRIDELRETPAAIRFLSIEPLIGDVGQSDLTGIHWVIVGGESGHKARPMHPEWARSIRDQCQAAGVSFFFKQWGEWLPNAQEYNCDPGNFDYEKKHVLVGDDEIPMCKAGKHIAGRKIDGRTWEEMPV